MRVQIVRPKEKAFVALESLLLTSSRNPTLSYTQRLEVRVRQLEDRLQKQSSAPQLPDVASTGDQTAKSNDEGFASSRYERLMTDDTGKVSFHGPTSILNLPLRPERNSGDVVFTTREPESERVEQWREHLVTNAWAQRAVEALSTEEVGDIVQAP